MTSILPLQFNVKILWFELFLAIIRINSIKSILKELVNMSNTEQQYENAIRSSKDIFLHKTRDYGTSWRVLRPISIIDQIFIKAQRIRTIQEKGEQRVGDNIASEFKGIVNYGVIGLIQLELSSDKIEDLSVEEVNRLYDAKIHETRNTMLAKNHDYGEAWRQMSQQSFTDLILMKLLRIRQILLNEGKTLISEGIDANFIDIINYSLFALILIEEGVHPA
jgi:Nucleotide modification associated domain 1